MFLSTLKQQQTALILLALPTFGRTHWPPHFNLPALAVEVSRIIEFFNIFISCCIWGDWAPKCVSGSGLERLLLVSYFFLAWPCLWFVTSSWSCFSVRSPWCRWTGTRSSGLELLVRSGESPLKQGQFSPTLRSKHNTFTLTKSAIDTVQFALWWAIALLERKSVDL